MSPIPVRAAGPRSKASNWVCRLRLNGALDARFRSQDPEPFANKILAMMRHEFGGHAVKSVAKD